jgi:ABC-type multidrug transport system fused ATPase/permease subunit
VLDLSRWQFAVTAAFHMTFPAITVGLSIFLCINYALYLRTRDPVYLQALKESAFAAAVAPPGAGLGGTGSAGTGPAEDRTGVLLHAVTSDAEIAENSLLQVASPIVTYAGVLAAGCVLIARFSPTLAGVIAAGGLAVAAIAVIPGWASSLRPGRRLAAADSAARQELVDALDGLDELASFGAEALGAARVEGSLGAAERAQRRLRTLAVVTPDERADEIRRADRPVASGGFDGCLPVPGDVRGAPT